MGINKINTLSFLKNKNLYSDRTLKEYNFLFKYFITNKSFINNGNLEKWFNIINELPEISTNTIEFSKNHIVIGKESEINSSQKEILEENLLKLNPWRKGPFKLFGLEIDSEWRSDKKWERIKNFLPNKKGLRICDLGCSNGYYAYKLMNLEPDLIVGLDKTPLFIMQFFATKYYAKKLQELIILPCMAEEFTQEKIDFDLLLSMGILYHAKDPEIHIETLNKLLKSKGFLILETIISLSKENIKINKDQTYAGMKNIGTIFTKDNLIKLINLYGFKNVEFVDQSYTDSSEQRATKWMPGKSIKDFLLPNGNTIEGYPPVCRAIFIAQKK